eukprot:Sdes_comp10131_c0_seq1m1743
MKESSSVKYGCSPQKEPLNDDGNPSLCEERSTFSSSSIPEKSKSDQDSAKTSLEAGVDPYWAHRRRRRAEISEKGADIWAKSPERNEDDENLLNSEKSLSKKKSKEKKHSKKSKKKKRKLEKSSGWYSKSDNSDLEETESEKKNTPPTSEPSAPSLRQKNTTSEEPKHHTNHSDSDSD